MDFTYCDHLAELNEAAIRFTNRLPSMAGQMPEHHRWACQLEALHPGAQHLSRAGTQEFWLSDGTAQHRHWWASWTSEDRMPVLSEAPVCERAGEGCLLIMNHSGNHEPE